nr:NmrA family NAD(P)-binding protein [Salinirubrum litoreum]
MRVLVVGATGRQGGAVVDALLADDADFEVFGLTRDPDSESARALAERGVTVVEGDATDRESMDRVLAETDATDVFLLTTGGADAERRQGETVVAAAEAAGVGHLVFSSGGNAGAGGHVPHVAAKFAVEQRLRESPMRWTIVRPHSFVSNLARNRDEIASGTLSFPIPEGERFAFVDHRDVGRLAVRAFRDPDRFAGETIELAGAVVSLPELAEAVSDVVGHGVDPRPIPREAMGGGMATFAEFVAESADVVDPDRLHRVYDFEPTDLRTALRESDWL